MTNDLEAESAGMADKNGGSLLCFKCNGALGQFRDRTDLMLRAVGYPQRGPSADPVPHPNAVVGVFLALMFDPPAEDEPRTA
ncbi:MAG: hypothetical protein ACR2LX_11710 [Jatrophihabitans sp.]